MTDSQIQCSVSVLYLAVTNSTYNEDATSIGNRIFDLPTLQVGKRRLTHDAQIVEEVRIHVISTLPPRADVNQPNADEL